MPPFAIRKAPDQVLRRTSSSAIPPMKARAAAGSFCIHAAAIPESAVPRKRSSGSARMPFAAAARRSAGMPNHIFMKTFIGRFESEPLAEFSSR